MSTTTTSSITLYKSLIYETVKNETHISAHALRATDKNASELAFNEEAGDEAFHERKLERSLYSSLDRVKTEIIDYLNTESGSSSNISVKMLQDSDKDKIEITLVLSSRFNTSYLTPLADLISKYVEDSMLFEWWTPINQNNAKIYAEKTELARISILKCFIKNAPAVSSKSYSDVTGGVTDATSEAEEALAAKILEAKTYRDTMEDGTKKDALSAAINVAQAVYDNATYLTEYTSATTVLDVALQTAKQ